MIQYDSHKLKKPFQKLQRIMLDLEEKGSLPAIEKDLALQSLRDLYEVFQGIDTSSHTNPMNEPPAQLVKNDMKTDQSDDGQETQGLIPTEASEQPKQKDVAPAKTADATEASPETGSYSQQETHEWEIENELEQPDETVQHQDRETTREAKPEVPGKERTANGSTIGDQYQGRKEFMDERISKQHPQNDVSVKMQQRPVADIGKAIGLNDKFLFVNELFDGDAVLYKNMVQALNSANSFEEAVEIINSRFHWDMDKESAQRFMDIVRRKYITIA